MLYWSVFLKLGSAESQGSAKGCYGFPETKMLKGRRVVLVVLKMYVWRHSTLVVPSLTARRQSVAASIQNFPDSVMSVSTADH